MYCRNYTGTVSRVLCREVYYTVSFLGRVHYRSFHSIMKTIQCFLREYLYTYVCTYVGLCMWLASMGSLCFCVFVGTL